MKSDEDTKLEIHVRLYDELNTLVERIVTLNYRSEADIRLGAALAEELIEFLHLAYSEGLTVVATDLTARQRKRLSIFVAVLCEDALNRQAVHFLQSALSLCNLIYIEDERYHELHIDIAIMRFVAQKLGTSLHQLSPNSPWGLHPEVLKRLEDIASRPLAGLLDSFELEVTRKNGDIFFRHVP
jgi:hypothetical protein